MSKEMRETIDVIIKALDSPHVNTRALMGHLIPRDPSGTAWSDSSLQAAGGYSIDMKFWWHIEWPEEIRRRTLLHLRNNKDGRLISINVLEYAGIIITFVAATHYFLSNPRDTDSQPVARLVADNSASESCGL